MYVHHISSILVAHDTLVLTMCHFFWSPLTLQDTSYSPEPHISAERSQSLLSAQEAVSLWVLGTRKVCILIRLPRDAILHFLTPVNVAFLHIICTDLLSVLYYIKNWYSDINIMLAIVLPLIYKYFIRILFWFWNWKQS